MTVAALVLADADVASLEVASVGLLDRLLISLHRAGCTHVTIACDGALPPLPRARALGVPMSVAPVRLAAGCGPVLLVRAALVVQPEDVRVAIERGGRLVVADGTPLPIGFAGDWRGDLDASLASLPRLVATRMAAKVGSPAEARAATQALWASLTGSADGLVDRRLNRPLGRPLAKLLVRTPVSPNAISTAASAIGMWAAWLFAQGTDSASILAALVFQLAAVVDCVDGDVARAACKETRLGKWLDVCGDQLVHVAIFAGIAVGLGRAGSTAPLAALAASAAVGTLCAFAVVTAASAQPRPASRSRRARAVDALTNRDFSVLLVVLALVGRLDAFLWCAALGVHAFWVFAGLVLLAPDRRRAPSDASS